MKDLWLVSGFIFAYSITRNIPFNKVIDYKITNENSLRELENKFTKDFQKEYEEEEEKENKIISFSIKTEVMRVTIMNIIKLPQE